MASRFRHPGSEDFDEALDRSANGNSVTAKLPKNAGVTGGRLGGLAIVGLILTVWAVNIATCFHSSPANDHAITPRSYRASDTVDVRIVRRLGFVWQASGGDLDSIRVGIVDDASINAASAGRGTFVLWHGLGQLPDDMLDAIYAHEIAHDQLAHARKISEVADVTNFIGEFVGTLTQQGDDETNKLKEWSGKFIVPRYSREQELEADQRGVEILTRFGYAEPASLMCNTFVHIRGIVGESGGGFFSDHPALSDRIRNIREQYDSPASVEACR